MARQRSVIEWEPGEIVPLLGKSEFLGLQNRPMVEEATCIIDAISMLLGGARS